MTEKSHTDVLAQPASERFKAIANDCRMAARTYRELSPQSLSSDSVVGIYERIAYSIDQALASQPPAAPVETALRECLQSIADADDSEPREPDDADWRFRFLEAQRAARCTLDANPLPQSSAETSEQPEADDIVAMARVAQHDDRMSTGALYGKLADEIERLRNFTSAGNDETKVVYVKRWRTLVKLPAKYADEIVAALRIPDLPQTAPQPIARAHVTLEDDGPYARLEVLNGEALQPSMSPIDLYARSAQVPPYEIAMTLALSYGRDPDEPAPILEMCDENNQPVPIWMVYIEQAEALLAAYSVSRPNRS